MSDDILTLRDGLAKHSQEWWAAHRITLENAQLREALEPFAVIGRAIRAAAPDNRWLERPLFFAGTDDDPQSMTLTGRAFDNAAKAVSDKRTGESNG
ncbi:MAG: hypothetical protein RBS99_16710 [Rhodospirillales bacterium]|jgi:hypothetical protein|nr:hypothetical protein [Rhodospirillales bacterium]